jgi:hypothetical protein
MSQYRCYLINITGRIHKAIDFEAATDEEAVIRAKEYLVRESAYGAVEVWQRNRFIDRVHR